LKSSGAQPVVLDALDGEAVARAVREFQPEVVMNQLTDLPQRYNPRKLGPYYERTSRLRVDATRHLLAGAHAAGAARFIYQSIAFMYRASGPLVLDEEAPLALQAPEPFGATVRATAEGERLATAAEGLTGVVLRYGQLYGPGTYFDSSGDFARQARLRMLPIVGTGTGIFSFLHVDDAASAAISALGQGRGVYNIVDDEPAPAREWIPAFCADVGAPAPMRVPAWLATILAGRFAVATLQVARGASNAKAKRELGWSPAHRTWRAGFLANLHG
jgi:nucleoside-diphosphate-sugar epimerase